MALCVVLKKWLGGLEHKLYYVFLSEPESELWLIGTLDPFYMSGKVTYLMPQWQPFASKYANPNSSNFNRLESYSYSVNEGSV